MTYHYIQIILTFISSIAWPLIVLILFFVFRLPLTNFLNNIKKFSYGSAAVETNTEKSQNEQIDKLENIDERLINHNFINFLTKFSTQTNEELEEIIEKETKFSEIKNFEAKTEQLYNYSKLIILLKNFERIYYVIFGSQIRILQRLNYSFTENKNDLKFYYENVAKVYPEIFKNYNYDDYLDFLFANKLINKETDTITITTFGQDFLRYLIESNLSLEKRY